MAWIGTVWNIEIGASFFLKIIQYLKQRIYSSTSNTLDANLAPVLRVQLERYSDTVMVMETIDSTWLCVLQCV